MGLRWATVVTERAEEWVGAVGQIGPLVAAGDVAGVPVLNVVMALRVDTGTVRRQIPTGAAGIVAVGDDAFACGKRCVSSRPKNIPGIRPASAQSVECHCAVNDGNIGKVTPDSFP